MAVGVQTGSMMITLHLDNMVKRRRLARASGVTGPWSCLACRYPNADWVVSCKNCSYQWETPSGRLIDNPQHLQDNPWYIIDINKKGWETTINERNA